MCRWMWRPDFCGYGYYKIRKDLSEGADWIGVEAVELGCTICFDV